MLMHINNYMGLSDADTKEYFDVGVYRNILDMLNSIDGVLNLWGNSLYNEAIKVEGMFINMGTGYAVPIVGNHGSHKSAGLLIRKRVQEAGLATPPPYNIPFFPWGSPNVMRPKPTRPSAIFDILNLSRSINWELNRVRLPVPHNFRQIADKIQGRNFNAMRLNLNAPNPNARSQPLLFLAEFITLNEYLVVFKDLKHSVNVMRNAVRKEMDAANLAEKVEEETLRREQAELISRQRAASEAEKRKLIILEEKKAVIQKEFEEAEKLKATMAAEKEKLLQEKAALAAQKENAATQEEAERLKQQQISVDSNINRVDDIVSDKAKSLNTARQAADNINAEIVEISKQNKTLNTNTEKPVNIKTILLTAAAGAFLL